MRNISKKIRKKLVKVINANCHRVTHFGEHNATFVPYDSSQLSAIWKYLCIRDDGVLQVVSWLIEAKNIFLSESATVASMLQNNYLLQERISKSANKLSID